MRSFVGLLLCLCLPCASAIHAVFIAPPASHYVPMIAVAHGLLDEGHRVTFMGFNETLKKIKGVVPGARMVALEGKRPDDGGAGIKAMQAIPTSVGQVIPSMFMPVMGSIFGSMMAASAKARLEEERPDVLCVSYVYPIFYALGEALDIPLVGIGWGTPSWLAVQTEMPWSLEPSMGSMYRRDELHAGGAAVLLENALYRTIGTLFMGIGGAINVYNRWSLGHPAPLELWEFDTTLQYPAISTTLPELTAGLPLMTGVYNFPVGILDHPKLAEGAFAKSEDTSKIVAWLDAKHAAGEKAIYFAFGSEVYVHGELAQFMADCFERGQFNVLWANKAKLEVSLPPNVFHTKFAPQRAVLQHPAVVGFISHGGQNSANEALMFGTPMVIIPFIGDQVANGKSMEAIGVARMVHKENRDPDVVVAAVREVMTEPFQRRSKDVAELNRRRMDLPRAVEVITNQATGKFRLRIDRPPAATRVLVLLAYAAALASACSACCCVRVAPQRPCRCCRLRRGREAAPPAEGGPVLLGAKPKQENGAKGKRD